MIQKLILSLFLLGCSQAKAYSQILSFPYDTTTTTLDGNIAAQEWENAAFVQIPTSGPDTIRVLYKHDMTAMYFAFMGKLESANALFPEVLLDPQNVRTSSWVNGQWWFHVSATDCENNGGYGVYNNCLGVQPGWVGVPNMTTGMPYTDTIEIKIPFSKIGFNPATDDTMGISMLVTNTATIFKMYPIAADRNVPSTWSQAVFSKVLASVDEEIGNRVKVQLAPNPARNHVTVASENDFNYELYETTGKLMGKGSANDGKAVLNVAHLTPSIYILRLTFENGTTQTLRFHKE